MAAKAIALPNVGTMQRYAKPVSNMHTVVPGQSVADVGHIHGVSPGSIMSHPKNRHLFGGSGSVPPGTRLFIPG